MNILSLILLQTADMSAESMLPHEEKLSIVKLLFSPGTVWITILLLISLGIIVYIFVERFLALREASKDDTNFMNNIRDFMHHDRLDSALALCNSTQSPMSHMVEKGLSRLGKPLSDINETISNVGQLEVAKLEKGVSLVAALASIAPMLGFLGTVTGMIVAFHDMATSGNNLQITDLANGIYTALITTVSGLVVGIIGYICHNILVNRIDKVVVMLEAKAMEFMDFLHEPAN